MTIFEVESIDDLLKLFEVFIDTLKNIDQKEQVKTLKEIFTNMGI